MKEVIEYLKENNSPKYSCEMFDKPSLEGHFSFEIDGEYWGVTADFVRVGDVMRSDTITELMNPDGDIVETSTEELTQLSKLITIYYE